MKKCLFIFPTLLVIGCSQQNKSDVVTQNFYHKYGFQVPKSEWELRHKNGKVISLLENKVTVTENYSNGVLDGTTTKSFPNETTIQKKLVYAQGMLLKEILYDKQGLPLWEKDYEFENRMIKTTWDKKGIPLSIEEFVEGKLLEAKYFDKDHNQEASIENGYGIKIKRNRSSQLLYKEFIEEGNLIKRITYHPNGKIHTESLYKELELDGLQKSFDTEGRILSEIHWNQGVYHGDRIYYNKGQKIQFTPFVFGKKHGKELLYHKGRLVAEIQWKQGIKHGSARYYSDNHTKIEWFFNDKNVTRNQFETLEQKEKALSTLKNMF
jgi:antitoxin component YwqK of YwqJK toxin-antitoxin module